MFGDIRTAFHITKLSDHLQNAQLHQDIQHNTAHGVTLTIKAVHIAARLCPVHVTYKVSASTMKAQPLLYTKLSVQLNVRGTQ
jgi:hypothetical protein